jgi:hypothetical protein
VVLIPAITVPKNALAFGPGYLYYAALGVSAPTNTVVGSVFTDTWPAGWNALGITKEGHTLTVDLDTDAVEAAEYVDPLLNVVTGRTISAEMELQQINLTNFRRVFNGGTLSTSGSGTTLLTTYTLPSIGAEIRCQVGWESNDGTERWWAMQCFNTGSVGIQRQKGADNATLPVTFTMEPDGSSQPVYFAAAGTVRG